VVKWLVYKGYKRIQTYHIPHMEDMHQKSTIKKRYITSKDNMDIIKEFVHTKVHANLKISSIP